MGTLKSFDDIKHSYYINLEHRTDRKEHVESQLSNLGIKAKRFNAIKMDNGAIGCSIFHLNVLQNALNQKLDHILIVEDDITFLDSGLFKTQINKFFEKHNNNWDVILLAGNNMPPYTNMDDTCIQVSRCQTTTGYIVNGHYIKCLIKNIKTGLINLINKPSEHIKFAIDKFWFVLQREGKWFLIIPLTVIQREDYSDIEKKVTNFEKCMVVLDKTKLINDFNKSSNYNKSTNSLHRFILHP